MNKLNKLYKMFDSLDMERCSNNRGKDIKIRPKIIRYQLLERDKKMHLIALLDYGLSKDFSYKDRWKYIVRSFNVRDDNKNDKRTQFKRLFLSGTFDPPELVNALSYYVIERENLFKQGYKPIDI